ncbi:hypothetical protein [Aureibacillus halotolerans]|uniref:Uncharacterized protein n=1 Tax=Aureibacillus halotolerans TaxID=1508390 RepID=A0A4R6UC38_9BACI|nr:hypothetical protein [Aureibacillus halotolerans]TDQ42643.1 hypothetical protein EV213_10172 [Aureibacillus halotolerans]
MAHTSEWHFVDVYARKGFAREVFWSDIIGATVCYYSAKNIVHYDMVAILFSVFSSIFVRRCLREAGYKNQIVVVKVLRR